MTRPVRIPSALAIAGLVVALAGTADAQVKPGSQQGLGLTGADIPQVLKDVKADPYKAPIEPACQTIPQEIQALNAVLGPDVDHLKTKTDVGQMAVGYARGMIPYRGVVRFLTRADAKDKALQAAATAGYARRGFLRGLEAHLHCAEADSPPVDVTAQVADISKPAGDRLAQQMLTPVSMTVAPSATDPAPITPPTAPAQVEESQPNSGR